MIFIVNLNMDNHRTFALVQFCVLFHMLVLTGLYMSNPMIVLFLYIISYIYLKTLIILLYRLIVKINLYVLHVETTPFSKRHHNIDNLHCY